MSKRILGRDLEVSSIGLGCMGMSHAYGRPSDKTEAEKLLQTAIDSGYTFLTLQKYMVLHRSLITTNACLEKSLNHTETRLQLLPNAD